MHRPGSDILDSFGQDKETIEAGSSSENRRTCQEAQLDILLAHQNFGICAHPASSISRGRMASPITTYPSQKHRGRLGRFHIRSKFNTSSAPAKSVILICDGFIQRVHLRMHHETWQGKHHIQPALWLRIIPIAIRNFVFSGSRLGSYLEVAIEPTHSNTEVLRGLAIE